MLGVATGAGIIFFGTEASIGFGVAGSPGGMLIFWRLSFRIVLDYKIVGNLYIIN